MRYLERYFKSLGKICGEREKIKMAEFENDVEKVNYYEAILLEFAYSKSPDLKSLGNNNMVIFSELGVGEESLENYLVQR